MNIHVGTCTASKSYLTPKFNSALETSSRLSPGAEIDDSLSSRYFENADGVIVHRLFLQIA